MIIMSPLKIGICLHYHGSSVDDPWVDSNAPIVESVMRELVEAGLLIDRLVPGASDRPRQRFTPTPKLHAYVAMLEATPLPEQKWIDPRTGDAIKGYGI